jgi:L-histidine N-alpha-methyltransferase
MSAGGSVDANAYPATVLNPHLVPRRPPPVGRLRVVVYRPPADSADLAADVRHGLLLPQKALPPKYFYDRRGAQLFDRICDLPEYYLTRTEHGLLEQVADDIAMLAQPNDLVELGSGASRKTRVLLNALASRVADLRYVAIDVSETMLRESALALLHDYPRLRVHAVVADYERDLHQIPRGRRRLVIFLGSTIGNLTPGATQSFLTQLRDQLADGEYLLLGVDLLKPVEILEAAYNDAAGLTAEFNRNILRVVNGALGADFAPRNFGHVAFFDPELSQIEMHLRAVSPHAVVIRKLDWTVRFAAGETIHTEISRKFTRTEVESALAVTGFELVRWYTPANGYFGLALARAA